MNLRIPSNLAHRGCVNHRWPSSHSAAPQKPVAAPVTTNYAACQWPGLLQLEMPVNTTSLLSFANLTLALILCTSFGSLASLLQAAAGMRFSRSVLGGGLEIHA